MRPLTIAYLAAAVLVAVFFFDQSTRCHDDMKCKAYRAVVKADLRNLVTAEEAYRGDYSVYTSNMASLSYSVSPGTQVQIVWADRSGWQAVGSHPETQGQCEIFVGVAPRSPRVQSADLKAGQPACVWGRR
jgi:hypothetical protein